MLPGQDVDHSSRTNPSASSSCFTSATLILCTSRIGTLRIFLAELEQDETPARLERALQPLQEHLRLLQLVIHVDHDREIDRGRRQPRIVHARRLKSELERWGKVIREKNIRQGS